MERQRQPEPRRAVAAAVRGLLVAHEPAQVREQSARRPRDRVLDHRGLDRAASREHMRDLGRRRPRDNRDAAVAQRDDALVRERAQRLPDDRPRHAEEPAERDLLQLGPGGEPPLEDGRADGVADPRLRARLRHRLAPALSHAVEHRSGAPPGQRLRAYSSRIFLYTRCGRNRGIRRSHRTGAARGRWHAP